MDPTESHIKSSCNKLMPYLEPIYIKHDREIDREFRSTYWLFLLKSHNKLGIASTATKCRRTILRKQVSSNEIITATIFSQPTRLPAADISFFESRNFPKSLVAGCWEFEGKRTPLIFRVTVFFSKIEHVTGLMMQQSFGTIQQLFAETKAAH